MMVLLSGEVSILAPVPPDFMLEIIRDIITQVKDAQSLQFDINAIHPTNSSGSLSPTKRKMKESLLKQRLTAIKD